LLLSNRNIPIAFVTAILFGIHPMHVESVAWVTERKDVLYGLFFMAGLISYTKYTDTGNRKQYIITLMFLILALLSKPAAVIFPLVLFCMIFFADENLH
jgi:predicted MFS family arabinose efflux permease